MVQYRNNQGELVWAPMEYIENAPARLWWAMLKLNEKLSQLSEENNKTTPIKAANALADILDTEAKEETLNLSELLNSIYWREA